MRRSGWPKWTRHSIVDVLRALDEQHPETFHRVMRARRGRPIQKFDPSTFRFIAEAGGIAAVQAFLGSLAERLTG